LGSVFKANTKNLISNATFDDTVRAEKTAGIQWLDKEKDIQNSLLLFTSGSFNNDSRYAFARNRRNAACTVCFKMQFLSQGIELPVPNESE